jgi:hypothetical protein
VERAHETFGTLFSAASRFLKSRRVERAHETFGTLFSAASRFLKSRRVERVQAEATVRVGIRLTLPEIATGGTRGPIDRDVARKKHRLTLPEIATGGTPRGLRAPRRFRQPPHAS